jgi:hypothetical protein
MRRSVHAVPAAAALLTLTYLLSAPAGALAATDALAPDGIADPPLTGATAALMAKGRCNTARAPRPFPAPAGAAYLTHRRAGLTGAVVGGSALIGPGLDDALPAGCEVDELGYNPVDGYLYGLHQTGRPEGPELLRIGRAGARGVAVTTIGTLATAASGPIAALVGDIDSNGRYSTLSVNALTQLAVVQRVDPANGRPEPPTAVRWDASCAPALNNVTAQERLHKLDPTLPAPERLLQDWAFNPADGLFYGYGSVDARDEYLGKTDPTSGWTIRGLPDQVIAVNPVSGAARCAQVRHTSPPGGLDRGVIGDTYGADTARGSAAIGGAAFVGPHLLELFETDEGRRWRIDVSRCFAPTGCRPTPHGRSARYSRDAAGNPYAPAQLTVRALTRGVRDGGSLAFASDELEPTTFTLDGGQSRTFDVVPGQVTVKPVMRQTGLAPEAWRVAAVRCNGGDAQVADPSRAVRLTVDRQERLVCTFEATSAGDAGGPNAGTPVLQPRSHDDGPASAAGDRPGANGTTDDPVGGLGTPAASTTLMITVLVIVLALGIGGGLYLALPRYLSRRRPSWRTLTSRFQKSRQ